MIRKLIVGFILMLVVSFYFFPFSFTFAPAINTKMLVAVFGILAYVFISIRKGSAEISEPVLMSALLATIFSIWCLFSITVSNTPRMTYVTYIVSYGTWLAGAYGVYAALRLAYTRVNLEILVVYLALAGVFQCIVAVLNDNYAGFSSFISRIWVGVGYYQSHYRMYGLGAALDPAGVRFSVIQVMIAHLFATSPKVRSAKTTQLFFLLSFSVIAIIGPVISRTTLVGSGLGLAYIGISLAKLRRGGFITLRMLQIYVVFLFAMAGVLAFSIYFYETSRTFHGYLRFGFEAFFNYVEIGEFRTGSTDILSSMWIWPEDPLTWVIGKGLIGTSQTGSDIGYCNFIFYCGTIGLLIFSIFFLYCHWVQIRKFRNFQMAALLLTALTFIVWAKVMTDIFFIDALLFCIAADDWEDEQLADDSADGGLVEIETT